MATANIVQAALVVAALVVVASVLLAGRASGKSREGFVSAKAREVHRGAQEVFTQNNDATFSQYKLRVSDADAVQYTDVRHLHRTNQLTPQAVQRVLT